MNPWAMTPEEARDLAGRLNWHLAGLPVEDLPVGIQPETVCSPGTRVEEVRAAQYGNSWLARLEVIVIETRADGSSFRKTLAGIDAYSARIIADSRDEAAETAAEG